MAGIETGTGGLEGKIRIARLLSDDDIKKAMLSAWIYPVKSAELPQEIACGIESGGMTFVAYDKGYTLPSVKDGSGRKTFSGRTHPSYFLVQINGTNILMPENYIDDLRLRLSLTKTLPNVECDYCETYRKDVWRDCSSG